MLQTIKKIFSIEELKYKIVFTLLMLVVCRIGAYIPVPGINGDEVFQALAHLATLNIKVTRVQKIVTPLLTTIYNL